MKKADLQEMENKIMEEVVKRRKLGGFDANAETLLRLVEWQLEFVRHLRENTAK